jgi:DNA repair exonuclease SbcCD nuclease subunit
MPFSLAISSDWHLERSAYVTHPALVGDSYFALEQQVDFCIANQVPLVGAGDLYEKSSPDPLTVRKAFEQITRLEKAGQRFYFTVGQHEKYAYQQWMGIHPWAIPLHRKQVLLRLRGGENIVLYGIDYQPATRLEQEFRAIPDDANVLVCHQVWREFMGDHLPSEGSLADLVPPQVKLVITGDFHVHKMITVKRKDGSSFHVLSPGSSTMQSLKEDSHKHFFAMGSEFYNVESIPLLNRPVERVIIMTAGQVDDTLAQLRQWAASSKQDERLPEELRMPIWHIRLTADASIFTDRIIAAAAGVAHLFLRPFSETGTTQPSTAASSSSFEEVLRRELGAESPLLPSAVRLWRSSDPKTEVSELVDELLKQSDPLAQEKTIVH